MRFLRTLTGRLALGAIVAVGVAALLFFWLHRPSPAAAEYARGQELAAAGMVDVAAQAYRTAIRRDPRYAPPYRALAQLYDAQEDRLTAVGYWRAYLQRDPHASHAWCRLAMAEALAGLEVPALRDAERELQQDPRCPEANLVAGLLYAKKSDAKPALDHLAIAASAYPDNLRVQLAYGRVLALSGQYDPAEQVLQRILTKDTSHAGPFLWLGYLYAHRTATPANTRQAERYLRQALTLEPDYPEANFEMGRLTFGAHRAQAALPYLQRAVRAKRHYVAALYTLAQVYAALGRNAEATRAQSAFQRESDLLRAEKTLLKTYAVAPGDLATSLALGRVELQRGEPEAALLFLQDAARRAPQDKQIRAALQAAEALQARQHSEPLNALLSGS